jgi:ABC-type antimicrobial peptide transport system permease subunit
MLLIARTRVEPASIVESIRGAFRELDRELPLASIRPLEGVAGAAVATRRLTLWLVAIFGLTAVVLAIVGIYGVIAQAVAQRTHEFGIRQALGATRADILRLVLMSGALMTVAGLAGGLGLAVGSTRLLGSLLYEVKPFDTLTFVAVAALLAAVSAAAAWLPAYRATRISAAVALRDVT